MRAHYWMWSILQYLILSTLFWKCVCMVLVFWFSPNHTPLKYRCQITPAYLRPESPKVWMKDPHVTPKEEDPSKGQIRSFEIWYFQLRVVLHSLERINYLWFHSCLLRNITKLMSCVQLSCLQIQFEALRCNIRKLYSWIYCGAYEHNSSVE